jgi:hypothetical protein
MQPGGPVLQPYSYSVPSLHRLFKNSSTVLIEFTISLPPPLLQQLAKLSIGRLGSGSGVYSAENSPPPTPPSVVATGATGENFANPCQYVHLEGWGRAWFFNMARVNIINDLFQKIKTIFEFSFPKNDLNFKRSNLLYSKIIFFLI